ncbi:hypothetical protein Tco_1112018 [Tanacetum coccineum]|uniref:Uncharacterized protein n=1 Tax=Tanacetum coccineum TaxID=301880 RepID=A0ABQ5INA2_9ASTR
MFDLPSLQTVKRFTLLKSFNSYPHAMSCLASINKDIFKSVSTAVRSGTAEESSVADTTGIVDKQDTSSRSGNDADIRPIYNEEPMAVVQMIAEINVFAIGQQHTKQPEFNNEGEVDQNVEQCHDTCPLPATLTDNQTDKLLKSIS